MSWIPLAARVISRSTRTTGCSRILRICRCRVSILRGQQLVAEGDTPGALAEYQKALTANPNSSLASYRIGEVLFNQRNYQAAANAYRDALRGDDEPKWTEVWSHIALGKIFDVTGQRDRAVNEYRQAVQTNDNTQGAVNEARKYLEAALQAPGYRLAETILFKVCLAKSCRAISHVRPHLNRDDGGTSSSTFSQIGSGHRVSVAI